MRLLAFLLVLLAVPATASAAETIGIEGTELVYRTDPAADDHGTFLLMEGDTKDELFVIGGGVTPGPGCEGVEISCSVAGITAVRVIGGSGDENVEVRGPWPVIADLGAGDDLFSATAPNAVIAGGPGDDRLDVYNEAAAPGPFQVDGGVGDDTLTFAGRAPGVTLNGGEGDDLLALALTGPGGVPVDFICGPGADRTIGEPQDRNGDGCARPVTGLTSLRRVDRRFREGRLEAPARTTVTLRRRTARGTVDGTLIARRTVQAPAGPLRVQLKTTAAGRRALRRTPKLPVWASIRTRTGSDSAEVIFASKLG
ncbi:hypothetical protein C8N24_6046 [Solirubrobacter pauli]|uniref:Hemolysin type calcium-binding protein n=1 Tax=Solirubrobacter pauli TaxID=166793 RepID=A0A660L8W8_9ACTN|nr:hypothetical protein [Solirubrobacter pauli]RKQ88010.1 hypothetical protein C8N24_6046 [Solirubrobacter pauli]